MITCVKPILTRGRAACFVAFLTLLSVGTASGQEKVEPRISTLVRQLNDQNHGSLLRIRAARALRDIGPAAKPAIPALIAALKDRDYAVQFFAVKALVQIGPAALPAVTEALKGTDENVRASAARVLGEMGSNAEPAIPALITALNSEASGDAGEALGRIGPSAVPALIEALKDPHSYVRDRAADVLGAIGQPAIPALSEALKNQDGEVRKGALRALAFMGPTQREVISPLIEALKNQDTAVRIIALTGLANMRGEAKAAVPAIVEAFKDQNKDVHSAAANALQAIGREASGAVPAMIDGLTNQDVFVRRTAARILGFIGPAAKAAVPALLEALKDQDEVVRANAVSVLAAFGGSPQPPGPAPAGKIWSAEHGHWHDAPGAPPASGASVQSGSPQPPGPAPGDALNDRDPEVRRASLSALAAIGPGVEAVPALIQALKDPDPPIRIAAIEALKSLKRISDTGFTYTGYNNYGGYTESRTTPELQAAMPALVAAFKDQNTEVRIAASVALQDIRPDAHAVVPLLIEALKDESPPVRANIAILLGRQGIFAKAAVPSMIQLMQDRDHQVVVAAAGAVADVGPAAKPARAGLLGLLSHPNPEVRSSAASALASVRLKDDAVVTALIRLLRDKDVNVRAKAVEALTLIDDGARTIPAFIAGLKDPEERLRSDLEAALSEIGAPAVPALVRAAKIGSSDIRAAAASVLVRIQLDTKSRPGGPGELTARVMRLRPVVNNKPSDLTLYEMVADYSRHRGAYNIKPGIWRFGGGTRPRVWPIHFEYEDYQQRLFAAEWEYNAETNKLYPSLQSPLSAYSGLWEYDAEANKAYPRDSLKAPGFWIPVPPYCCKSGPAPPVVNSGAAGAQGKETAAAPTVTNDVRQNLAAFRGKVVILNLWATWSAPCNLQIPALVALQNKYRDQRLEIVGVSIDPLTPRGNPGGAPAVAPFMKANGINYHVWMVDNAAALAGYDVSQGIPTTYLLDREGRTVKSYVGVRELLKFEEDLKKLLP